MTEAQLAETILLTVRDSMPSLLVVIAVGAGVKIVLDVLFTALYGATSFRSK